jgi:hypothetical protein
MRNQDKGKRRGGKGKGREENWGGEEGYEEMGRDEMEGEKGGII